SDQAVEQLFALSILDHWFYAGQLWLDLRYHEHRVFNNGWKDYDCAAAAAWNPADNSWRIIPYPDSPDTEHWVRAESSAMEHGGFYVAGRDYLRRCDLKTGAWESFSVPWQKPTRLFVVAQRILAANDEGILEILDGGRTIKVLASTRRRPAAST